MDKIRNCLNKAGIATDSMIYQEFLESLQEHFKNCENFTDDDVLKKIMECEYFLERKIIAFLRTVGMRQEIPGHSLLVITIKFRIKSDKKLSETEIDYLLSGMSLLVPRVEYITERSDCHQWMLEAIRSIGCQASLTDFVEFVAGECLK